MTGDGGLDALDLALLTALTESPRSGVLELSRRVGVARATAQARLQRLEESGVIAGYGPEIDLGAAGFAVQAFVTLEIAQGALAEVTADLVAIPGVLEAHATTGAGDVLCRVAADSHGALQEILLRLGRSSCVVRSTSVIALSELVHRRALPLLAAGGGRPAGRAPAYRAAGTAGAAAPADRSRPARAGR
jgi:DNA-binding Lrp family transcriptional regulator